MKHKRKREQGFTLIELLIVMSILALLAAMVLPNLFGQQWPAEVKAAKEQISLLETALDLYRLDVRKYPTTEQGLNALRERPHDVSEKKWRGPYLKHELPLDPWGNPYVYRCPGERSEYEIISYGADNQVGGEKVNQDIVNWKNIDI